MQFLKRSMVLGAALILSGCATTRPIAGAETLAPEERVTLIESPDSRVYVTTIDGRSRGLGMVKSYVLAPGTHEIAFSVWGPVGINSQGQGSALLRHDFAPGKTYSVQSELRSEGYRVWIRDNATGEELQPAPRGDL